MKLTNRITKYFDYCLIDYTFSLYLTPVWDIFLLSLYLSFIFLFMGFEIKKMCGSLCTPHKYIYHLAILVFSLYLSLSASIWVNLSNSTSLILSSRLRFRINIYNILLMLGHGESVFSSFPLIKWIFKVPLYRPSLWSVLFVWAIIQLLNRHLSKSALQSFTSRSEADL